MVTGKALDRKPYVRNLHVGFAEGDVVPAVTPRRGALLYKEKVKHGKALAGILILRCAVLLSIPLSASVVFDAPGHVYTDKETPFARGGVPGVSWVLTDWRGRPVVQGPSGTWRADGTATLPQLPTGYYHLKSGDEDTTFAVVPVPEGRNFDHSSFYGIDSAQSGISHKGCFVCPWNGGDTYRTVSDLIWRTGIPHARERLRWEDVNRQPEVLDYRHFMYNANMLRARSILVSGLFHDAPPWAGRLTRLPSDLNATYTFCSRVAAAFGDRMGDWEFWNEQEGNSAPEPVWDYAAALKAAYLGFKAGRPGVVVLPGSLCLEPDSVYSRALYANDAAKFSEVFNYHTYDAPANYPQQFAALRAFMKRHGIGDMAIWITESGTNLEGQSDKTSAINGFMAHSPEQELVKAEFYPKSQIALQMEGVARNYYFVFGAYNERNGAKDWGVMRRDGTVKPEYAAISTMTRELISARLVGEMAVGEGFRAYLFEQTDGTQTIAYWSVSPLDTQTGGVVHPTPDFARDLSISVANGTYRLSDLCGTRSAVTVTNGVLALVSTRFPAYVAGLRGLVAKTPPHPTGKVKPYVPAVDEDMTVILRVDLDPNDFEITNEKTRAILKGDIGRLRLQVWNMGDEAKTGHIEADIKGGSLSGLPGWMSLGPRGTPPATFDCTFVPDKSADSVRPIVLTSVFGGKRSSRLVMSMRILKDFLASCEQVPIAWQDPKNWERNTSAQSFSTTWDEAEQAVRFDVAWTQGSNRWLYPIYKLNLPKESLEGAQMFRFEVKSTQDTAENDFRAHYMMLVSGAKKRDRSFTYQASRSSWETRYVEFLDGDSLSDVVALRIGANPKGTKCSFWLRNLSILKATPQRKNYP